MGSESDRHSRVVSAHLVQLAIDFHILNPSRDAHENRLCRSAVPVRGQRTHAHLVQRAIDFPILNPSCDAHENRLCRSAVSISCSAHLVQRAIDFPILNPSCDAHENRLCRSVVPVGTRRFWKFFAPCAEFKREYDKTDLRRSVDKEGFHVLLISDVHRATGDSLADNGPIVTSVSVKWRFFGQNLSPALPDSFSASMIHIALNRLSQL